MLLRQRFYEFGLIAEGQHDLECRVDKCAARQRVGVTGYRAIVPD